MSIPNGQEELYYGAYDYGYKLGAAGGILNSGQAILSGIMSGILINPGGGFDGNDPGMMNINKGVWQGYLDGQKAHSGN